MPVQKIVLITCLIIAPSANAGWGDLFDIFSSDSSSDVTETATLTEPEIVQALKSALDNGVSSAIGNLGRLDGYYADPQVKIPIPESLQSVSKALRTLKQEQLADEFELTMNRAAEQAVPEAADIFIAAIKDMSISDAQKILQGPDDAATAYLRRSSGERIAGKFHPIISDATDRVGVTARFKGMMAELGPLARWIDTDTIDLDRYITEKAVDGLFLKIADEEKRIRENPAARTTEILQRVFGRK